MIINFLFMQQKCMKFFVSMAALAVMAVPLATSALTVDEAFGSKQNPALTAENLAEQSGLSKTSATQDPRQIIARVINILLGFLGIIAVILIIYAGVLWMTAAGDEKKVGTAQNIMKAGVFGLIIILAAFGIARFAINALIGATQ